MRTPIVLLFCLFSTAFTFGQKITPTKGSSHPSWIMQGNIYEVNVRQYTPEGTFKAFEPHLQRLKNMGVQTLWFMPVNPISKKDRKGELGSYYAVSNYTAINPEYGTMADWKHLVNKAHSMGFKVIIDWVPNHTGADHPWLTSHPDFFERNEKGEFLSPFDWTDVRKLNYKNSGLVDSMIASMKFWIKNSGIDGFRCDVASDVPIEFWSKCIKELRKLKTIFMLAEANAGWLHKAGFDATYTWDAFSTMKQIAKGERPAFALDSVQWKVDSTYPKNALRMFFTSNHDENSWNKADYGTMPGASHAPFSILTFMLQNTVPLIYGGQEEPFLDSLSFFWKDTISFGKFKRAPFYKTLLNLRKNNPAMASDVKVKRLHTSNDAALYALEREKDSSKVLVIVNLTNKSHKVSWKTKPSSGPWSNVFAGQKNPIDEEFSLQPWGYAVYEMRKAAPTK